MHSESLKEFRQISCLNAMLEQINGLRREHRNLRISTYGLRKGCSCGFALYMMGTNRYLSEFFQGLHHQPWAHQSEKNITPTDTQVTDNLTRKKEEMNEMIEDFLFRGHLLCNKKEGMLHVLGTPSEDIKEPGMTEASKNNSDVITMVGEVRDMYTTYIEKAKAEKRQEDNTWARIRSLMRRLWYTYVYYYASPRFKSKSQDVIINKTLETREKMNVLAVMIKEIGENENDLWLERDDIIGFGLVNSTTAGECDTFRVTTHTKTVRRVANVSEMNNM